MRVWIVIKFLLRLQNWLLIFGKVSGGVLENVCAYEGFSDMFFF